MLTGRTRICETLNLGYRRLIVKGWQQFARFARTKVHPLFNTKRFHFGTHRVGIDKGDGCVGGAEVDTDDIATYLLLKYIFNWLIHA